MTDIHKILDEYIEGGISADGLRVKYAIDPDSELAGLLEMAELLDTLLIPIQPSSQFITELRAELLGKPNLLLRLRGLSATQVAAGIGGLTVAAGILWYARKSALDIMRARRANMVS